MIHRFNLCVFACISCFVFLAWSPLATAQTFSCDWIVVNNTYWNLSALTTTQIRGRDIGGYYYYLKMCGVAPACRRDGAMACQISSSSSSVQYAIAFPNDDINPHTWNVIDGGIQLDAYGTGIYCENEQYERKTIINVNCDPGATTVPTNFSGIVVEGPPCTYTMNITHISGCGGPVPVTTMPPVPSSAPIAAATTVDDSRVTGAGIGLGVAIGIIVSAAVGGLAFVFVKRRGNATKWSKMEEDKGQNMSTLQGTTREPTNM